ncbi:MAG TPA: plastocyanin/azurin family copper-binding protein [Gemmatimonadales bacterium]|nr:plastocyanin/azurin family copper-binding protein [Gemmatimonadales bacterium]
MTPALVLLLLAGTGLFPGPAPQAPRRHVVEIRGMAFQPATLAVARGDTVVWINHDIVPHTATAMDTTRLQTGTLLRGQQASFVADRPGELGYICQLHPTMRATLVIR